MSDIISIQDLANRVALLEATANALIKQFLPPVTARIGALETTTSELQETLAAIRHAMENASDAVVKETGTRIKKRTALTYEMFVEVQRLRQAGNTQAAIARALGLPQSTVSTYCRLSPKRIQDLLKQSPESLPDPIDEPVYVEYEDEDDEL